MVGIVVSTRFSRDLAPNSTKISHFEKHDSSHVFYLRISAFDVPGGKNTIELNEEQEYTRIFKRKPLGFKVLGDEYWNNAIVTTILEPNCGVVRGSLIMRINNIYVHGMPHDQIGKIAKTQPVPLEITFVKPFNVIHSDL